MRATITRKLIETKIYAYSITTGEDGEPHISKLEAVTVFGKVSRSDAVKEVKKAHPECEVVTVSKIEETEGQYEISVEDFVKNAKRIEHKNDKKENEE